MALPRTRFSPAPISDSNPRALRKQAHSPIWHDRWHPIPDVWPIKCWMRFQKKGRRTRNDSLSGSVGGVGGGYSNTGKGLDQQGAEAHSTLRRSQRIRREIQRSFHEKREKSSPFLERCKTRLYGPSV